MREVLDGARKLSRNPVLELSHSEFSLSPKIHSALSNAFLQGIPFSYQLAECEFLDHAFFVSPDVLIPRPETELLVDHLRGKKFKRALDIGTGSGVIILSLLKERITDVGVATDVSAQALEVAGINAKRLRLTQRVSFVQTDRLAGILESFDLIVSNPPYIKESSHRELVQKTVDQFEPQGALYLPDASYDAWFSEFFRSVFKALEPEGVFMMEGHELELRAQAQSLEKLGFKNVQVVKDLRGLDRFLFSRK